MGIETPEFEFPDAAACGELGTWAHIPDYIQTNGKTSYPEGEALEALDEATQAAIAAEQEDCPPIAPLSTTIADDTPQGDEGDEGTTAWKIKQVGDKSQYTFN